MTGLEERLLKYNEQLFFGEWRLDGATPAEALLGKGSFGSVYAVYREEKDRTGHITRYENAIKVIAIDEGILREKDRDKTDRQKQAILDKERTIVEREIRIMKSLEGESNIVYFEASQIIERTDTRLECCDVLIRMEKLVLLRDYLSASRLMPGSSAYLMRVLYMWREIAAALTVCERKSILHTDVKPDNVFYAPGRDHFKLSDFGTSIESNSFPPNKCNGTRDYMAPEMYHMQGGDSRIDMYSLAIMIYELLNGSRIPFQTGTNREQARNARLEQMKPVPPISGVPADINRVLLRCLDSNPTRRYANCSDMADEVTELYLKYNKMKGGTFQSGQSRRWVVPVAAGVIIVGALGLGGVILSNMGEAPQPAPTVAVETPSAQPSEPSVLEATVLTPRIDVTFDQTEDVAYIPGEPVRISGRISVLEGELDPDALVMLSNSAEWEMDCWPNEDGSYGFRGERVLNDEGSYEMPVSIHDRDTSLELASGEMTFVSQTPVPTETAKPQETTPVATATETPVPSPETTRERPELWLNAETSDAQPDGAVTVKGILTASIPVDWEGAQMRFNGEAWDITLEPDGEGGCTFMAAGRVPADEREAALSIEVQLPHDGETVSQTLDMIVSLPEPTPSPAPELTLKLRDQSVVAGTGEIVIGGTVLVNGTVNPADLAVSVNGSGAESIWEAVEGGYSFTAVLDMDLNDVSELEIGVYSKASAEIAAVRQILPVETPGPTETPAPEIYRRIEASCATAVEGYLGADEVLVLSLNAEPEKTLTIHINGEVFGAYSTDAEGKCDVDILSSSLTPGEVSITADYSQRAGSGENLSAALTLIYDPDAPEVDAPAQIDSETKEVTVKVKDASPSCRVVLYVDGEERNSITVSEGQAVLAGLDELGLTAESQIELIVTDHAGNQTSRSLAFEWKLQKISIQMPEDVERIGPDKLTQILCEAEPDSVLEVSMNGKDWGTVRPDANGQFFSQIPDTFKPKEGDNTLTLRYRESDYPGLNPEQAMGTVTFNYDSVVPSLHINMQHLLCGEREIPILVDEESAWSAYLYVESRLVDSVEKVEADSRTLHIPEDIPVHVGDEVRVEVVDAAGNETSETILMEGLAPIRIRSEEGLDQILGVDEPLYLTLSGEEGARFAMKVNGELHDDAAQVLKNGQLIVNVAPFLRSGDNEIEVLYSDANGYPAEAMEGTSALVRVICDFDSPQVEANPTALTRDTNTLRIKVSNEKAYAARYIINDEVVFDWQDYAGDAELSWDIADLNLKDGDTLAVEVTDKVNDAVRVEIPYSNTSEMLEAYAYSEGAESSDAQAGATMPLDVWAICSAYDMGDGYVTMRLTDENGKNVICRFSREKAEEMIPSELALAHSMRVSDYADSVYRITGVEIPETCDSGAYTLEMQFETEHEKYVYPLGTVNVQAMSKGTRVSEDYEDEQARYAIGLDAPLQPAFRPDDVVLTGWACCAADGMVYYDRYEVVDAYGRTVYTSYFSEGELTELARGGLEGDPELTANGKGFILKADLSSLALKDGDVVTIQLYSSNEVGTGWETVNATVLIDANAPQVSEAELERIQAEWTPPEPTPTPDDQSSVPAN